MCHKNQKLDMAKNNNVAMGGKKAGKADETNITRKSATNDSLRAAKKALRKALMTAEELVSEGPKCVDLYTVTKGQFRELQTRNGKLYKSGEYTYKFTEEGAETRGARPWECFENLAKEKPYSRISANANGATLHVFIPQENIHDTEEVIETYLEQTERLCMQLRRDNVKVREVIDKLHELKTKMLGV